jgi:dihydrofolate reductase
MASAAADEFCTWPASERMHRHPEREDTVGKLIVTEQVTLDGVAQAPGGPDDDRDGGFTHGGWQAPLMGREADDVFEQAKSMDALLLGRRTYEIFANYWPTAPAEIPFTSLLNGVPKYVASRTLAGPLDWRGSAVVGESTTEADSAWDAIAVVTSDGSDASNSW